MLAGGQIVGQQTSRQLTRRLLACESIAEAVILQPAFPAAHPLGTIVEILIKQISQLTGQLPLLTLCLWPFGQRRQQVFSYRGDQLATLVTTEIIPQWCVAIGLGLISEQTGQQSQQSPGQWPLVEGR